MHRVPSSERRVRLFRNGRNQAVRIPRDFEIEGDEAIIRKDGDQLVLQPVETGRLLSVLSRLKPLQEEFPDIDEGLPPLDMTLVSANVSEFSRVPGLRVVNWLSEMETAAES